MVEDCGGCALTDSPMGVSAGDLNGDGRVGWGGDLADVDNDGRSDLWVAAGNQGHEGCTFGVPERPCLHLQNPEGGFDEVALDLGMDPIGSRRTTWAHDLNQDGVLDLWLSSAFEPGSPKGMPGCLSHSRPSGVQRAARCQARASGGRP